MNTMNKKNETVCTVKEFADMMRISMPTAYQMTNEPGFPLFRVGRRKLVILSGIDRWMSERTGNYQGV